MLDGNCFMVVMMVYIDVYIYIYIQIYRIICRKRLDWTGLDWTVLGARVKEDGK